MTRRQTADVETYLEKLRPEIQELVRALREVILSASPGIQESIKWSIPFYTYKGLLCYINPAKNHVSLGFCRGAELSNTQALLTGNGKEVRHIIVRSTDDIRREKLSSVIHEAVILNEIKSKLK